MNGKHIITIFAGLLLLSAVAYGHTSYRGYSGAPGSNGRCASSCHGGSGGSIEISGFPSEYIPEQTYAVTISHSGDTPIRQFNGSCRVGEGSENASLIEAGTNTATYSVSGETNGVRFSSSNQNSGMFLWTAPSSGTGEVRLYIAGLQGSYSGQNSNLTLVATEQMTDMDDAYDSVPSDFALIGNYPNPFNAATIIKYSLSDLAGIKIEIVDILGRSLETLFEGQQAAGFHEVVWVADNYSSGVYLARLEVAGKAQTIKTVLLK